MAAALKTFEQDFDTGAVESAVKPKVAEATAYAGPSTSPARELQASLAKRLERSEPSTSEVLTGLVVGVCGACWVTGILIYATL